MNAPYLHEDLEEAAGRLKIEVDMGTPKSATDQLKKSVVRAAGGDEELLPEETKSRYVDLTTPAQEDNE